MSAVSLTSLRTSVKKLLATKTYSFNSNVKQSVWTAQNIVKSPYKDIDIPNRTIPEHVWENLERWPDKIAVTCGITNRSISYHQLYKYSQIFAAQLRTKFKINDSDVICVMMNNMPEYSTAFLGCLEAGAEVTTVNPTYTAYEVQRQIALSNPKVLIGNSESVPVLKEASKLAKIDVPIISCDNKSGLPVGTISFQELIEDTNARLEVLRDVRKGIEDIALLPYSSGTTGLPKGVELTNRNIIANCMQQDDPDLVLYDETSKTHQESVLCVLPYYHIYGLTIAMLHKLSIGCKLVTLPKFQPNTFVDALEKHKITLLYAAPPLILFLGSHHTVQPKHLASTKKLISAAAPLPQADIHNVLQKSKGMEFLQLYGLTETSPLVTSPKRNSKKYTSVGLPVSNTELRIVNATGSNLGPNEIGELLIRGPQVMKGYRNNIEATKNAFIDGDWFKSGDLASIDEDGYLTIADRLKELIKVKGYQVPPAELENVIKEHPDVLDAGVIGVPDPRTGERPKAFVVIKDGHKTTPDSIEKFVAERVTEYKRLKEVVFLESLPKNPSGKLLRRVLRDNELESKGK